MPRKISRLIILLLAPMMMFCLFAVQTGQARRQKPSKRDNKSKITPVSSRVVLISVNGLRADFLTNVESSRLRIPTIQSLQAGGSSAVGIESVFPSQTIPAHASMITGTLPADHGVTSDFAFDVADAIQSKQPFESAKDIKTSPIFELAERAKLVTAAVGFPVTSGAAISFNLPEEVEGGNGSPSQSGARPDARPVVSGSANPPNLRAEILSAIKPELNVAPVGKGDKGISSPEDLFKASAAAYLIEKYKPNLLLVNFASFEAAQRRYGILSEESLRSLEMTDGMIKKIIDATNRAQIAEETTFLLVADSGAAKVEKEYSPNVLLAKKGWLKTDAQGRVVSWQAVIQSFEGSAAVYIKDPKDEDFAREVEAFFHEQAGKPDSPIWRVMPKRETSKLGADPRAVLYLDAAPTYVFTARTTGAPFTKAATRAARGYAPSRVEMRAAFLIAGAGIKPGVKVEYARLIDVAPTIARLLGLEMKTARGRALTEVIRE